MPDAKPAGSSYGPNVRGEAQPYLGPHPPPGPKHHYHLQVFALDTVLTADPTMSYEALTGQMQASHPGLGRSGGPGRGRSRSRRAGAARSHGQAPARAARLGHAVSGRMVLPVSNSDLRLEMMRGQPPDTASMNLEFSFSIEWLMVSLAVSPTGSISMTQRE